MAPSSKRKELEHVVGFQLGRELGARGILFHQAIANLAGVSVTDLKCLDYVDRVGDVTAGDLARLTGLNDGRDYGGDRPAGEGGAGAKRTKRDRPAEGVHPVVSFPSDGPDCAIL